MTFDVTNPLKPTIVKDPDGVLDYSWDWTAWLLPVTDTITSFVIQPTAPLTVVGTPTNNAGVVRAFISGGISGNTYAVECEITTAAGRIDARSIYLKIKDL